MKYFVLKIPAVYAPSLLSSFLY